MRPTRYHPGRARGGPAPPRSRGTRSDDPPASSRNIGGARSAWPTRPQHVPLWPRDRDAAKCGVPLEDALLTLSLFLGLTLGIRHAADADHVATIAAVVVGRTSLAGALHTAI